MAHPDCRLFADLLPPFLTIRILCGILPVFIYYQVTVLHTFDQRLYGPGSRLGFKNRLGQLLAVCFYREGEGAEG